MSSSENTTIVRLMDLPLGPLQAIVSKLLLNKCAESFRCACKGARDAVDGDIVKMKTMRVFEDLSCKDEHMRRILKAATRLQHLTVVCNVKSLVESGVTACSRLRTLIFLNCPSLESSELAHLRSLTQLETLHLAGCRSMRCLKELASCSQLRRVNFVLEEEEECRREQVNPIYESMPHVQDMYVRVMGIIKTDQLLRLCHPELHNLGLHLNSFNARDLEPFRICSKLQSISLNCGKCEHVTDLAPIAGSELLSLVLTNFHCITDLGPLRVCTRLEVLAVRDCFSVVDLGPLCACTNLQVLDINNCSHVTDQSFAVLASLKELWRLWMTGCYGVTDIGPLSACTKLQDLDMERCVRVRSIAPLAACKALYNLRMVGCTSISDIAPLSTCTKLHELNMSDCTSITNIAPLSTCANLQVLHMTGCTAVTDLTSLRSCSAFAYE